MYWCWPPVAIGLPTSQCLLVQHLFTDSSLSFAPKIIFLALFESLLVVLLFYSVDILLLVLTYKCQPPVATGLPASQCLLVQHMFTDSSLIFASKLMFLELFESFLVVLLYIHMPLPMYQCWPSVATCLPASQCLPFTHISLSFASKIMFLDFFESSPVGLSFAGNPSTSLSSPTGHSTAIFPAP